MSERKNRLNRAQLEQAVQEEAQVPTVSYKYRIDVDIPANGTKTTYMVVTGVPADLPAEYENTVKHSAEAQFAAALNQRLFLEFYNEGKTNQDEQPVFYNLSRLDCLRIRSITKID